jgi:N-acetylneuraminic acid mutarotase
MRMRRALVSFALVLTAAISPAATEELQPLPVPLTNNAVAVIRVQKQYLLYSFMGLGAPKAWNSVTNAAYALNMKYDKWTTIKPVPGSGRLGATASGVKEQVFVMGGFVPDPSGRQSIVSDVSIYEPIALRWYRGADLPTAVRDAVAGVYRDRYVYIVGGFGKTGPTNQIQIYDSETDHWLEGTPFPGAAVFGHAGAIVDDAIVYVDGAKKNPSAEGPRYIPSDECWIGKIDHRDPKKIEWSKLPAHPGTTRYRIAAGASDRDDRVYFAGGSDTVYDYSGIGLDGKPAEPSNTVFAFNRKSNAWETLPVAAAPTMDHRALGVSGDGLILAGGMGKGQQVLSTVTVLPRAK